MFPQDIVKWLRSNQIASYAAHLAASKESVSSELRGLGVEAETELAHFYVHYGPCSVKGWYELDEVDTIADSTKYAHTELGVPENFLALSGVEGQGIILYDTKSGAVFDVEYGQFEQLRAGVLCPVASSVVGYLRWCMDKGSPPNKSLERTRDR